MSTKKICPRCHTQLKKLKHSTICGCGVKLTTVAQAKK